jgi:hypothetical protein
MIHVDAHSDTNVVISAIYIPTETPSPGGRGLLDPKRTIQIGIRPGSIPRATWPSPRVRACASSTWRNSPSWAWSA